MPEYNYQKNAVQRKSVNQRLELNHSHTRDSMCCQDTDVVFLGVKR